MMGAVANTPDQAIGVLAGIVRPAKDGVTAALDSPAELNVVERIDWASDKSSALRRAIVPVFAVIKSHLSENTSLVLHITASMPGEGTSTVARELALCAAKASWCKVLLVDGNPSQNGQSDYFGLSSLPVLSQSLLESGRIDTVGMRLGDSRFHLSAFPLGEVHVASANDPSAVPQFYQRLRATFRLTIVDCPPIMTSPDTASLSGYADGVILVIEAEKTRVPVIMRAKKEIEEGDGKIYGVVMNKRKHYIPNFIYRLL